MGRTDIYLRASRINRFPECVELAHQAHVSVVIPELNDGVFGHSMAGPVHPRMRQWWWR